MIRAGAARDRNEVTLEHGAAGAAALGDGRLAVLPGTHGVPVELPEINPLFISVPARALCCLTEDFLRQGPGDEHLRHSGACQRI
jgi:hypothetical protein